MAAHLTSAPALQAISIRCDGCGGTFGVLPTPGQATCPYCQREQLVSAQMLGQLEQYGRAVHTEVAHAEAALDRASAGKAFRNAYQKGRHRYVYAASVISAVGCAGVSLLVGLFHVTTPQTGMVIAYAAAVVPFVVLWGMARRSVPAPAPAPAVQLSNLRVACSNCGAVAEMVPGAAAHRCPYCQTAIVASRAVIQHGVGVAVSARREAQREELHENRRVATTVRVPDASKWFYYIGAPLVLLGLILGAQAMLAAQRGDRIDEIEAVYVPVFGSLALAAGLVALFLVRASRRSRCRSAMRALFAPYPNQPIETREELVEWLNRHWPAPYDMSRLGLGRYFLCTQTLVWSYPLLLRGNLWPPLVEGGPALHLLLAARFPLPESVPIAAQQAVQHAFERCRLLGFEVQLSEAGVLASATDDKLDVLRRSPRELGELGPALHALAEAAASVRALPN